MNIILSAVLPAAAGVICVVDDDRPMLKALNRFALIGWLAGKVV